MTIYQATRLCPAIRLVPPDHAYYAVCSSGVMAVLDRYTPVIKQNSTDEAWLDLSGCLPVGAEPTRTGPGDHGGAEKGNRAGLFHWHLREQIPRQNGRRLKKTRGITTLWPEEVEQKLWPLPVGEMYAVGRKMRKKLTGNGILTIGDLVRYGEQMLITRYGK